MVITPSCWHLHVSAIYRHSAPLSPYLQSSVGVFECLAIPAQHDHCTDYLPVYFQACKGASPVLSGVYSLAFSSLGPAAIITGISVKATGRYRLQSWIGWTLIVIAIGLMSTVLATDPLSKSIGYAVLLGLGAGFVVFVGSGLPSSDFRVLTHGSILTATPMYPILAPLPVSHNAPALAFMWFLRSFASVSITIPCS